jgi:hypothetical protein
MVGVIGDDPFSIQNKKAKLRFNGISIILAA